MRRWLALMVAGLWTAAPALAQDVAGSADHPLIGRFDGAVITGYDARDFDEYRFAQAPMSADGTENAVLVEGVTTRIAYVVPTDASIAEVARNYEVLLADTGFDIILECADEVDGLFDPQFQIA